MYKFFNSLKKIFNADAIPLLLILFLCLSLVLAFFLDICYNVNKVKYHYVIKKGIVLLEQNDECNEGYCTYKTNYGELLLYYKEISKLKPNTKFDLFIKLGTKYHEMYINVYTNDPLVFNYYTVSIDKIDKSTQSVDYNFFVKKYKADMK